MLFGPIFAAEMITAARRRRYYFIRVVYATCLLLLLWTNYQATLGWYYRLTTIQQVSAFAATFFRSFAVVQILAVGVLVPAMFAGAIAQERERRTIEYLLTSRLSVSDIILAKVGVRLVQVAVLLLTGFGILSVARLLGGIENAALLSTFVSTAVVAFAGAGLSMAISTWSRRSRDAVRNIYSTIFLFAIALPGIAGMLRWMPSIQFTIWQQMLDYVTFLSPMAMLSFVLDAFSPIDWTALYICWGIYTTVGVGGIIISILTLRRAYERADRSPATAAAGYRGRMVGRRRQLADHPMVWKELATGRWNKAGWLFVAACFLGILSYIYHLASGVGFNGDDLVIAISWCATAVLCVAVLSIGARAATAITSEQERDCWTTLLSSGMEEKEVIWGKVWGSIHSARHIIGAALAFWLASLLFDIQTLFGMLAQFITFTPVAIFAAGLGITYSLSSKTSTVAVMKTSATLLFLNGGWMCCCIPVSLVANAFDDKVFVLLSAPISPFLFGVSGMVSLMFTTEWFGHRGDGEALALFGTAYVIGVVGYTIAGLVLVGHCIVNFDQLTGRSGGERYAPSASARRPAPAAAHAAPEPPTDVAPED